MTDLWPKLVCHVVFAPINKTVTEETPKTTFHQRRLVCGQPSRTELAYNPKSSHPRVTSRHTNTRRESEILFRSSRGLRLMERKAITFSPPDN